MIAYHVYYWLHIECDCVTEEYEPLYIKECLIEWKEEMLKLVQCNKHRHPTS